MPLHRERSILCCSLCEDMMMEPTTIPCGHNFCMICINKYWKEEEAYNCPECKQAFDRTPRLVTNPLLAELVGEKNKRNIAQHRREADEDPVDPSDVFCDFCEDGKKMKAVKSCQQCLISICEVHLEPHFDIEGLKQHTLVAPSKNLVDKICSSHNEVMKIFCRTDHTLICDLCSIDNHKDHDTVTMLTHVTNKQKELVADQEITQVKIEERIRNVKVLQEHLEMIDQSAEDAIVECKEILSEVIEQIRSRQKNDKSKICALQKTMDLEISSLKKRQTQLRELSYTNDHMEFLNAYNLLLADEVGHSNFIYNHPLGFMEDVGLGIYDARMKLKEILHKEFIESPIAEPDGENSSNFEPVTREDFFKLAFPFTIDMSTANMFIKHNGGLHIQCYDKESHRPHPESFTDWCQVLCRQSITSRCYWEVWLATGSIINGEEEGVIAVAYKSISRSGPDSAFGNNSKSWALHCFPGGYEFKHNNVFTPISGPSSVKIGVYLDYEAGTLSFYSIENEMMTLLHKEQCTFTEPLYAGASVFKHGQTAEFVCELYGTIFIDETSDTSSE